MTEVSPCLQSRPRPAVRAGARRAPTPTSWSSAPGSRGSLPRASWAAGFDVLVLEARDRVGGRTWTDRRLGHELELGATWVHWVQPHVRRDDPGTGGRSRPVPRSRRRTGSVRATTRDLAGLQRPAAVVHFASSDNASLWGARRRRDRKRPARGAASRSRAHHVIVTARTQAQARRLAATADELRAAMTAALGPGWVLVENQLRRELDHDIGADPGS